MQAAKQKTSSDEDSDSDDDKKKGESKPKQRLFSEAEVLDIEEAQERNAFEDI